MSKLNSYSVAAGKLSPFILFVWCHHYCLITLERQLLQQETEKATNRRIAKMYYISESF